MKRTVLLVALAAAPLVAQDSRELPRSVLMGGAIQVGRPQGEFAANVDLTWGVKGFVGWQLGEAPVFFRADLGYHNYGSETRRVPLGSGPLGLIRVDVNTTNNILDGTIGLQAGRPGARLAPYVNGAIGFSNFFTSSSVSGSSQTTSEAFASSSNHSDATFAKTLGGGLYIPVGTGGAQVDLGVRYHWNGEARYLTEHDITFDAGNNPVLSPRRSRADLLVFSVGVAFQRR